MDRRRGEGFWQLECAEFEGPLLQIWSFLEETYMKKRFSRDWITRRQRASSRSNAHTIARWWDPAGVALTLGALPDPLAEAPQAVQGIQRGGIPTTACRATIAVGRQRRPQQNYTSVILDGHMSIDVILRCNWLRNCGTSSVVEEKLLVRTRTTVDTNVRLCQHVL